MNATMKNVSRIAAAAALVASAGFAQAGSSTADLAVSASVAANCTISTTAVAFGAYDPVSGGNVSATGTVVVGCTKAAASLTIGLGDGANGVGGQRNLNGSGTSNKLAYALRKPVSVTPGAVCDSFGAGTAWSAASTLALTSPTSKATRTYNVCGEIASGQDVSVDSYADTVVATITF